MADEITLDRRIRKTRTLLRQCLTTLMKEKKIQEISVKELADMADINRGTFYLHYRDVYDMLKHIENEMFEEFEGIIDKYTDSDLHKRPYSLLEAIFSFVQENQDMCQVLLGANGDLAFFNDMKGLLKTRILNTWKTSFQSEDDDIFEAYYAFIISGCVGLMEHWFETGLKKSPKEMAQLAEHFVVHGSQFFDL